MTFQELMDCYVINENENNSIVYKRLLEMCSNQNITPIIGAGISCWAYPLWGKLLRKLAIGYGLEGEIEELIKESQYEKAASLLDEKITHNELIRQLRIEFRYDLMEERKNDFPKYLENIPKLFQGPIVTTNFDRVIEYIYYLQKIFGFDTVTPFGEQQEAKVESALSYNKPILVKMHGDIQDSGNLVLTEESYNSTYGANYEKPDFDLPMPKALRKILKHNPVLFLGCSLSADRTCSVIKNCASEHNQFALLELPQETNNEENPWKPNLRGADNKFKKAFENRRCEIIDKLNISAIWYPYGMNAETYKLFFSQLCEDLGVFSHIDFDTEENYDLLHPLLGRQRIVEEIVEIFINQSDSYVWIEGAVGIGKTEICKKAYKVLKEKCPKLIMPYIDVTGIKNLQAFFDTVAQKMKIPISNPVNENEISQEVLDGLRKMYSHYLNQKIPVIMYFDNLEDIWYELADPKEKEKLIEWTIKLKKNKIGVLVSCREVPWVNHDIYPYHVNPLDDDKGDLEKLDQKKFDELDSVKLFCEIFHREIFETEKGAFRELIKQLEGHPLAIVLAATQARSEINLDELLKKWHKAKQHPIGMRTEHESLEAALRVSWDAIALNHEAVIQWGLLSYSLKAIPQDVYRCLQGDATDEAWEEGRCALSNANLIYITPDRKAIGMLFPLKKQFMLVCNDENIKGDCLIRWAAYIEKLLDKTKGRQLYGMVPQIFYIMEQLMEFGTDLSNQYLNQIVVKVRRYYQLYVQSANILNKLIDYYEKDETSGLLPLVLEDYGNILRRLGDLNGAEEAYDRAERLYHEKNDYKGIANLLKSRGDLARRQGNLDEAKKAYDEAENGYRQINDSSGLMNLLKARGDLLRLLKDFDGAKEIYLAAALLYRQERDNQGLANLLKSLGDLFRQMADLEEAENAYSEAERLYCQEEDDLGSADLFKSKGDLLRQQDKLQDALTAYDEAQYIYNKVEQLYPRESGNFGGEDLKKSRQALLRRLKPE